MTPDEPDGHSGVTFIGPRAFVLSCAVMCGVFFAILYAAGRIAESIEFPYPAPAPAPAAASIAAPHAVARIATNHNPNPNPNLDPQLNPNPNPNLNPNLNPDPKLNPNPILAPRVPVALPVLAPRAATHSESVAKTPSGVSEQASAARVTFDSRIKKISVSPPALTGRAATPLPAATPLTALTPAHHHAAPARVAPARVAAKLHPSVPRAQTFDVPATLLVPFTSRSAPAPNDGLAPRSADRAPLLVTTSRSPVTDAASGSPAH